MMTDCERQHVDMLRQSLEPRIAGLTGAPWNQRRIVAHQILGQINAAWWHVHELDPTAYDRDLQILNARAGWNGEYAQIGEWRSTAERTLLMPPKFFGGDPLTLEQDFIASMSLNHAVLPKKNTMFAVELLEQQDAASTFIAHRQYFLRSYAYARFFRPRGLVLHAFARAQDCRNIPPESNWRELNLRYAFYIELYPTRSKKFRPPTHSLMYHDLGQTSFVMALNMMVHDVVLRVLRPRTVLLAGKKTWDAWPDPELSQPRANVGQRVRRKGRPCPVYVTSKPSALSAQGVLVARANFLRTVYGPNSNIELRRLGKDVLGRRPAGGE